MSDYSTAGPPPPSAGPPGMGAGGGARPAGPPNQGGSGGGGEGGGGGGGGGQAEGAAGPGPGGIRKDAFADAVQQAWQIAAKIGGDSTTTVNNTTPDFGFGGQKRQLEDGDQPESKKMAPQPEPMPPPPQLGPIHPLPRSTVTEEYRVPDGMVGLIIGRGGEQINKIQQDSGCKVQ